MEGYQEHHVAKILLSELDTMSEKDEMWTSKLKVLQENVRHHVEEEEKEMFPASKQVLSDQAVRVSLSDLQIVTIKMRSHGLSKELDLPFP
jgi:hemerythrin-like domain-containing protein